VVNGSDDEHPICLPDDIRKSEFETMMKMIRTRSYVFNTANSGGELTLRINQKRRRGLILQAGVDIMPQIRNTMQAQASSSDCN